MDLNFSLDIFHPAYFLRWVALQLIRNSSLILTPWKNLLDHLECFGKFNKWVFHLSLHQPSSRKILFCLFSLSLNTPPLSPKRVNWLICYALFYHFFRGKIFLCLSFNILWLETGAHKKEVFPFCLNSHNFLNVSHLMLRLIRLEFFFFSLIKF